MEKKDIKLKFEEIAHIKKLVQNKDEEGVVNLVVDLVIDRRYERNKVNELEKYKGMYEEAKEECIRLQEKVEYLEQKLAYSRSIEQLMENYNAKIINEVIQMQGATIREFESISNEYMGGIIK